MFLRTFLRRSAALEARHVELMASHTAATTTLALAQAQLQKAKVSAMRSSASATLVGTVSARVFGQGGTSVRLSVVTLSDFERDNGRPDVESVTHTVHCMGDVLVKYIMQSVGIGKYIYVHGTLRVSPDPVVVVAHPAGSILVISK